MTPPIKNLVKSLRLARELNKAVEETKSPLQVLNPRLKFNKDAAYRVIGGNEGYLDALSTGVLRKNITPTGRMYINPRLTFFTMGHPNDKAHPVVSSNGTSPVDKVYKGDIIAEVLPEHPQFSELLPYGDPAWNFVRTINNHNISVNSPYVKFYKKDPVSHRYFEIPNTLYTSLDKFPLPLYYYTEGENPFLLNTKTYLGLLQRAPKRINAAERAGIPKGQERTLHLQFPEILENALNFAKKYGYEIPLNILEIKLMYKLHNSFVRSVDLPIKEEDLLLQGFSPELAKIFDNTKSYGLVSNMSTEDQIKFLTTHGYPRSRRSFRPEDNGVYEDPFVFVATEPLYSKEGVLDTGVVRRPFSWKNPLNWHINADWKFTPGNGDPSKVGLVFLGNNIVNEVKLATPYLISDGLYTPEKLLTRKLITGITPVQ